MFAPGQGARVIKGWIKQSGRLKNYDISILCGALALLCALWIWESVQDASNRDEAIASVVERNENLAVALEHFTARTIQTADSLTKTLKAEAERSGALGTIERIMASGLLDRSLFQSAGIIDEHGSLAATTLPGNHESENFSDREHFGVHVGRDSGAVFVGKPVVSKILGEPSIPVTRRINKPDGSFGGVAVAQMSPSRFSELYKSAKLHGDDFISVVGTDGIIRVRRTGERETFGEDYKNSHLFKEQPLQAAGHYSGKGLVDGTQRFVSYRTLQDYNLVVTVGTSEERGLADYKSQQFMDRFATSLISILVIIIAAGLSVASHRKGREAQELLRVARHDPLTGLPGRILFQERFAEALELARTGVTDVSLLLLDLDDFKSINDSHGHDAGDALLQQTAERLQGSILECDTVARLGGDEFGILLVAPLSFDNAVRLSDLILEILAEPCHHEGHAFSAKASIGVAGYPRHGFGIIDLMKDADIALYRAKAEGGNRSVVFTQEMRAALEERRELLDDIRRGLSGGEFVPFYQPKVCFKTGEIVGFEALARWQHPAHGLVTPAVFGVAFEDVDLAERLGAAMIRMVAADVAEWLPAGLECGRVAVNLSSAEFRHPELAQTVIAAWTSAGAPVERLEIEVTETVFLGSEINIVANTMRQFRQGGIQVALDDFGTGFASLAHLKRFDVDHIKIDQSFVRGLLESTHDQAIVSAVIALGESFDMDVTAEGVETEEQALRLTELGCDHAQGYLYAKPMAASRVPYFLKTWTGGPRLNAPERRVAGAVGQL